ncbi:helix-turn-helix transcriptional regulator [Mucilaginibacter achroorhodeus]|uniref:Helix-turn-helix transcriptional regulator n=1 Tax=Mucilaginibacter achroorhodeus TaxID=2599294 RepID=A0A563U5P6_9SPHI|nr:helix-turn-helix transcriptional regulator [Mucilaginibacter achroorhodeus]TWR26653.1 helix-turn-helix transcriptional regulator [Mucilaginibacter achroorhodeus]
MKSEFDKKIEDIVFNIRLIREKRNYTQEYMAAKMQCSQNAYSKLELGYSKLTVEKLLQVAEVLDVTVAELVNPQRALAHGFPNRY